MEKPKVAIVISHPIQYYVPLLKGLTDRNNIEIKVFYTWGKDSINKFDPGFNRVIEWDTPLLNGYDFEFLENTSANPGTHHYKGIINPALISRIEEYCPNKIVVFGWSFQSHLKVLRYFKGKIPIYFRGDSHLLNEHSIVKGLFRRLFLKWVYSHIDFAISVGTNNKNYYKWSGLSDDQILFAPHAIDEHRFIDEDGSYAHDSEKLKAALGIPNNHIVFIYIGKFEYRKDLHTLINAKLLLKDQDCSLIMLGNGPDETTLKELAKSDRHIYFVDFMNQSKMPMAYRCGDVFILPSISETWGLGINEAMNCGLAIIASNKVGAAVDLISNNGFIFECSNVLDLKSKMQLLINENGLLSQFQQQSLINIRKWSIEQLVINFEKALL